MKKQTLSQAIRASLLRTGSISPKDGKPVPLMRARPNHSVSKLNAVLARRSECSHA